MKPFYYTWSDARGMKRTVNLHWDGTASIHPDYLNWTLDQIRDRIRRQQDIVSAQWDRADIAWRNGRLRWMASLNALLQYNLEAQTNE